VMTRTESGILNFFMIVPFNKISDDTKIRNKPESAK